MRHMTVIALLSPIAFADQLTMPVVLTNNTVADAMDVNANMEALLTESNENDARITTLETNLKVDETYLNVSLGSTLPNIRPDSGNDLLASQNTAVGIATLHNTTTGFNNTATGYKSLWSNTVGGGNSSYGVYALHSNLGGNANVAVGYKALYLNQDGIANVASGHDALHSNADGDSNTANGYRALRQNVSGSFNTASGSKSLLSNISSNHFASDEHLCFSEQTICSEERKSCSDAKVLLKVREIILLSKISEHFLKSELNNIIVILLLCCRGQRREEPDTSARQLVVEAFLRLVSAQWVS